MWDIQYPASDFFFLNKTQAHLQDLEPVSKLAPALCLPEPAFLLPVSSQPLSSGYGSDLSTNCPFHLASLLNTSGSQLNQQPHRDFNKPSPDIILLAFMNTSSEIKYK